MKKDVTEERTFCDFCAVDEGAYAQCLVCGKDICRNHAITLTVYLDRQDRTFRASLCPEHAQVLKPLLVGLKAAHGTWENTGQNPAFNEVQLDKIVDWLDTVPGPVIRREETTA